MVELTVVGVCSYAPAVHRWLQTLRRHFDGRCLLYLTDPPDGVAAALRARYGIEVVHVKNAAHFWQAQPKGRYCEQWRCVLDACMNRVNTGVVLRTDVWDVVFQDDPRKHVPPDTSRVLVAHEGVAIGAEAINRAWVGPWLKHHAAAPVVNGGMVCAPPAMLAVLAGLVLNFPLGTSTDQSELQLIANAFTPAFEYRPGFMECMYQTFFQRGTVRDSVVCDRQTGQPWCVVHGNGREGKARFESLFPLPPAS